MKKKISIQTNNENLKLKNIKEKIKEEIIKNDFENDFEIIEYQNIQYRQVDVGVLVAIVSVIGTSLGVVITGLLSIVKESKISRIIIESKSGTKIDVSRNVSEEEIKKIITLIKEFEGDEVNIKLK